MQFVLFCLFFQVLMSCIMELSKLSRSYMNDQIEKQLIWGVFNNLEISRAKNWRVTKEGKKGKHETDVKETKLIEQKMNL